MEDFIEPTELESVFGLSEHDVVGYVRGHRVYLARDGELLLVLKGVRGKEIARGAVVSLSPTSGTVTATWSVTGRMNLTQEEINSLAGPAALQKARRAELQVIRDNLRSEESRAEQERRKKETERLVERDLFEVRGGSGHGHVQLEKGKVYQNSRFGTVEGEPEFFFVLESKAQYHSQDGGDFGVGAENGYSYRAVCRAAKEDEIRDLMME